MAQTDDGFQPRMKEAKGIATHVVSKLKREKVSVAVDITVFDDHITFTMRKDDKALFSDKEKDQIRKVMLSDDYKKTVGTTLSKLPFKWEKVRIRVCSREKGNQQYVWSLEKVTGKK